MPNNLRFRSQAVMGIPPPLRRLVASNTPDLATEMLAVQADKRESPWIDTGSGVESRPAIRFEPLLVTGNQMGRRMFHGENEYPGEFGTSVSDLPRGMCSRWRNATPRPK